MGAGLAGDGVSDLLGFLGNRVPYGLGVAGHCLAYLLAVASNGLTDFLGVLLDGRLGFLDLVVASLRDRRGKRPSHPCSGDYCLCEPSPGERSLHPRSLPQ